MKKDKVKFLIEIINIMDIKDKLRLAIRMSESDYTNLKYDKQEKYKQFETKLKDIDEEYKKFPVINSKYIIYTIAKLMEMNSIVNKLS